VSRKRSMSWCCALPARIHVGATQRIVGELAGVGVRVSATTVAKILREACPRLERVSW